MEDIVEIGKYIRRRIDTSRYFRNFGFKYGVYNIFRNPDTDYISCDIAVYGAFVQLYRITVKTYGTRVYTPSCCICTRGPVGNYVPADPDIGIVEEGGDFVI